MSKLLIPVMLLVLVAAVALVMLFLHQETRVPLQQPAYQYFMLEKQEYTADTKLLADRSTVVLDSDGVLTDGDVTPFYFQESVSFLIPTDMSWSDASGSAEWAIPAYSHILLDENEVLWCEISGKRIALNGGFLSNGRGTYVFLEKVTLLSNGVSMDLSPLSFYSTAQGMHRVYDYESETLHALDLPTDTVIASTQTYQVDLTKGIFHNAGGGSRLLAASPKVLPKLTSR